MKKSLVLPSLIMLFLFALSTGGCGAKSYSSAQSERPASTVRKEPDTIEKFSYYLDERLPQEVRDIVMENRRHLSPAREVGIFCIRKIYI